jgi:hypothetical protein
MKLLIDCNEVFDILTRGPFPSGGEHDEAVEHHLRSCHDCRQLAEALRPAVELFHECLSEQEAKALPEYHGQVVPLDQPLRESLFRALPRDIAEVRLDSHDGAMPSRSQSRQRDAYRGSRTALLLQGLIGMALTAAIVLTVISLGMSVRNMDRQPGVRGPSELALVPVVSGTEAARRILSWQLPGECVFDRLRETAAGGSLVEGATLEQQLALAWEARTIECCMGCHHASQDLVGSQRLIATMQNSCIVCHPLKVGA